mmetsp:Transcript_14497/g.26673  ORF Transcript_14497/g.26673 Transcript_14497/m.26673 type:complete len:145 (+) Transcript_14497:54-488(+)
MPKQATPSWRKCWCSSLRLVSLAVFTLVHEVAAEGGKSHQGLHVDGMTSAEQAARDCTAMCGDFVAEVNAAGAGLVRAEQHVYRQRLAVREDGAPCPCSTTTMTTGITTTVTTTTSTATTSQRTPGTTATLLSEAAGGPPLDRL